MDEIGEMALELQPKLLRILQEHEFEGVGGTQTLCSNARIIAATNRSLRTMVDDREFREDLYYRLNVFPIHVPPLRERAGDIPLLARSFLKRCSRTLNKEGLAFSATAMEKLVSHSWPGNVRELQNVIERAVIVASAPVVDISLLEESASPRRCAGSLADINRAHIVSVLEQTSWVISGPTGAAARLGLKRTTLHFRIKKLGITRAP